MQQGGGEVKTTTTAAAASAAATTTTTNSLFKGLTLLKKRQIKWRENGDYFKGRDEGKGGQGGKIITIIMIR